MFDINAFQSDLDGAYNHLLVDFSQLHTGRASSELVEDVKITAYGAVTPLKGLANITVIDSRTINIQPWDKNILEDISKGIGAANLGFQGVIDGDLVRVKIPEMTEERRKEYVKIMKEKMEHARISVRNVRQDFMKKIDSLVSGGMSEDEGKRNREEIEKRVKAMNEKIALASENKEKDLMSI